MSQTTETLGSLRAKALQSSSGEQQTQHLKPIARRGLLAIAAMVLLSVVAVFSIRLFGTLPSTAATWHVEEGRTIVFRDGEDGVVRIEDATTSDLLATIERGELGFVRTALRAAAYSRRLHNIPAHEPMVLGLTANGRMILQDPSTGRAIGIDAFGKSNVGQFETVLKKLGIERAYE